MSRYGTAACWTVPQAFNVLSMNASVPVNTKVGYICRLGATRSFKCQLCITLEHKATILSLWYFTLALVTIFEGVGNYSWAKDNI